MAGDGHCSHSSQDSGWCWYDWAIAVTAPGTVDDADMTELYEFRILYFYGEGDYEAAEGEVMSSSLLELVKYTGTVHDADDVAIPAVFVYIMLKCPSAWKVVCHNKVRNDLFDNRGGTKSTS